MILDPRQYRLDTVLRRPYGPGTLFGPARETLWADSPQGWGFQNGIHRRQVLTPQGMGPLLLNLSADGDPIPVGDAISRPSHVTQHGHHLPSGLQITEDKFISDDDVLVSVLSVRNSGEATIGFELDYVWGVPQAETSIGGEAVWIRRDAPPGDDLRQRLPPGARRTLVFTIAFAETREEALRRGIFWRDHSDPLRTQVDATQASFDTSAPRFDCSDPWLTKLWYYRWHQWRRLRGEPSGAGAAVRLLAESAQQVRGNPATAGTVQAGRLQTALARFAVAQFEDGAYEMPGTDADRLAVRPAEPVAEPALVTVMLDSLLGIQGRDAAGDPPLIVNPDLLPAADGGWTHFCVENVPFHGRLITVVWDDPADPATDAYQDGDMGLTVYSDGRRVHHQEDLSPLSVELPL